MAVKASDSRVDWSSPFKPAIEQNGNIDVATCTLPNRFQKNCRPFLIVWIN